MTQTSGACNDVAVAFPLGRAPILIAAYASDGQAPLESLESAHADVARAIARALGPLGK